VLLDFLSKTEFGCTWVRSDENLRAFSNELTPLSGTRSSLLTLRIKEL
jgi:hypothetical protein